MKHFQAPHHHPLLQHHLLLFLSLVFRVSFSLLTLCSLETLSILKATTSLPLASFTSHVCLRRSQKSPIAHRGVRRYSDPLLESILPNSKSACGGLRAGTRSPSTNKAQGFAWPTQCNYLSGIYETQRTLHFSFIAGLKSLQLPVPTDLLGHLQGLLPLTATHLTAGLGSYSSDSGMCSGFALRGAQNFPRVSAWPRFHELVISSVKCGSSYFF